MARSSTSMRASCHLASRQGPRVPLAHKEILGRGYSLAQSLEGFRFLPQTPDPTPPTSPSAMDRPRNDGPLRSYRTNSSWWKRFCKTEPAPRPDTLRSGLRSPCRRFPGARILREHSEAPAEPPRRPAAEHGPGHHRETPHGPRRDHRTLCSTPDRWRPTYREIKRVLKRYTARPIFRELQTLLA
jgi:hypothetical protein